MPEHVSSRYNLIIQHPHDVYNGIVANTFSGAIVGTDEELMKTFTMLDKAAAVHRLESENPDMFSYLVKNGFLVENCLDEIARVRIRFQAAKFVDRFLHLTICPTIDCNLACQYCYQASRPEKMSVERLEDLKQFVSAQASHLSSFGVTWYGGEPLLELGAIVDLSRHFINLCKERNIPYSANIITNGTLINENTVNALTKAKITTAQITLDGPPDVHNARRCFKSGESDSFGPIVAGIRFCQGYIPVNIRINIDNSNVAYYQDLVRFLLSERLLGPDSGNGVALGLVKQWTPEVGLAEDALLSLEAFRSFLAETCLCVFLQESLPSPNYTSRNPVFV